MRVWSVAAILARGAAEKSMRVDYAVAFRRLETIHIFPWRREALLCVIVCLFVDAVPVLFYYHFLLLLDHLVSRVCAV